MKISACASCSAMLLAWMHRHTKYVYGICLLCALRAKRIITTKTSGICSILRKNGWPSFESKRAEAKSCTNAANFTVAFSHVCFHLFSGFSTVLHVRMIHHLLGFLELLCPLPPFPLQLAHVVLCTIRYCFFHQEVECRFKSSKIRSLRGLLSLCR